VLGSETSCEVVQLQKGLCNYDWIETTPVTRGVYQLAFLVGGLRVSQQENILGVPEMKCSQVTWEEYVRESLPASSTCQLTVLSCLGKT